VTVTTSFYYFPNDLFRLRGKRISIRELDEISKKYGTKVTGTPDKVGASGPLSKYLFRAWMIDIFKIVIEGEREEVVASIRAVYDKYGTYETFRGKEGALAREVLKSLQT